MAVFRIRNVMEELLDVLDNGFEFVTIRSDEITFPESMLMMYAMEDGAPTSFAVSPCVPDDSEDYRVSKSEPSSSEKCFDRIFTYDEVRTITSALANALIFYEDLQSEEGIPQKELEKIKLLSDKTQALQLKLKDSGFSADRNFVR